MFKGLVGVTLVCVAILSAHSQTPSSKYQSGTVTAVKAHQNAPGEPDITRYDVSIKVGDAIYTVLCAPANGANSVEYSTGLSLLVLVGTDTLTFNSKLSGSTEVPILNRQALLAQPGLDWSKLPGQYFTMKQEHLSEALSLTEDQQIKIKPILEQETAEAGQFMSNPVLSRKDKLKRWENVVRSSDDKIKPFLSQSQLEKLQQMRKEQKEQLKRLIA